MTHIWKLVWALIGGVITVVGGIVVFYFTDKAPDLVFQSFPPSQVVTDTAAVSIYSVRLDNTGNKEATAVQVYLALPEGSAVDDVQVEPSLRSIDFTKTRQAANAFEVLFPLLNPGDGSQFSLLVSRADDAALSVEVRANGVTGRVRQSDDDGQLTLLNDVLGLIAVLVSGAAIVLATFAKALDFRLFLQRGFTRQIRALQSRSNEPTVTDAELTQRLLNHAFRFHYNPSLSLNKSKLMRFGPNGAILEGGNKNETTWRLSNGLFEFLNAKNEINSRFYYSSSDQTFYQVPDADTVAVSQASIGDQYFMQVAAASPGSSASAGNAVRR